MKQNVIHLIGLVLAITSGVFAMSALIIPISSINPQVAQWWPVLLAAATTVDRVAKIIGNWLAPEQFPPSEPVDLADIKSWKANAAGKITPLVLCCFLFTGCATKLYSPATGKPLAVIQSNASRLNYSGGGVTLTADTLNNSTPTNAAFNGANKVAATVGSAAVAIAIPGTTAIPLIGKAAVATVPHFTSKPVPTQ